MIYEFFVIISSILIVSYTVKVVIDSCRLDSVVLACLPVLLFGGPLLGILTGLYFLDYYPKPPFQVLINFQ